nr:MAG TPA: hypothetical protein [Caudoviricetes sp.]
MSLSIDTEIVSDPHSRHLILHTLPLSNALPIKFSNISINHNLPLSYNYYYQYIDRVSPHY